MVHVYTHIDLVLLVFMKSTCSFHEKWCLSLFRYFSCAFHFSGAFHEKNITFHIKSTTFHENHDKHKLRFRVITKYNMKDKTSVHAYTIYTYMHHQTDVHHQIPQKYKIYLVGLPSVLYGRSGQNERSGLNQLFSFAFQELFMKTNKTRSICEYTCTIYTYMHHQIPPKYKIYLVGPPSVLYERPGQNERSVLNQLFLLLFIMQIYEV